MVAFQLPKELFEKLQNDAKKQMLSISALIRLIILDHYNNVKDDINENN